MSDHRTGPLAGLRVLDVTSVVMGPLASRILGDLGADVVVVEGRKGERHRAMGGGPHPELSGIALNLLRNKRSIALDLKADAGRQACLDLAATADVMLTNLRPGPVARLGLDYESVRAVRPDVIYCQAHGYPSDSDQAEAPAYDDIIQSASGVGDIYRLAGHEPSLFPTLVADKVAGMTIANAVLAALVHRGIHGDGQFIEIPMIDAMRSFLLVEHGAGAISEPPVGPAGYPRILTPQRRPQATQDGWINVLPYDKAHYNALFGEGGRPDLVDDERFLYAAGRYENSDSLYRDVSEVLATRTTAEWLEFCERHRIPAAVAETLQNIVANLPITDHPVVGSYRTIPTPERFSATPTDLPTPAPLIGQDGRALLREIGYRDETIDRMEADGVLGAQRR